MAARRRVRVAEGTPMAYRRRRLFWGRRAAGEKSMAQMTLLSRVAFGVGGAMIIGAAAFSGSIGLRVMCQPSCVAAE